MRRARAAAADDVGDDEAESATIELAPGELLAVWKPTRGEQPLFDFPIGTLTRREVAAFLVSEATGWSIVPPTLLRDGPFGEGSIQQWIEVDEAVDVVRLVMDGDARLRRIAVFDAIVNNTDRKGGHLLPIAGGHIHAVDHGVTFSTVPKLRTLLWNWEGEPFSPEELEVVARVRADLGGRLGADLRGLLHATEVEATRQRVERLLDAGIFPSPIPSWPAIPWPPF
ncbi:MAG TPA: SCO1664 family protein [Candidatus Limnocylindrales bacterium]|nr:SCO1664 family protein [Candidatus Limnocylindrales bacterium]